MRSLRKQLSLSILLILLVTISLIGLLSNWFINRGFEEYITNLGQERRENIVHDFSSQFVSH